MTLTTGDVELCRRVPIHKIIGNPNTSRKIKILCPFHGERNPSCVIFPDGGFKCFSCGAHGNTVDFVAQLSDRPTDKEKFKEALEELQKYI